MAKQSRKEIIIEAKNRSAREFREFTRLNKLASQSIRENITPAEKYRKTVADLKKALGVAALNQEQFNRAMRKARRDYASAERASRQSTRPATGGSPMAGGLEGGFVGGAAKVLASAAAIEASFRGVASVFNLMAGDTENFVANIERLPVIGPAVSAWMELYRASASLAAGEWAKMVEYAEETSKHSADMIGSLQKIKDARLAVADQIRAEGLTGIQRKAFDEERRLRKAISNLDAQEQALLAKAKSDLDRRQIKHQFDLARDAEQRLYGIRIDNIAAAAIEEDRLKRRLEERRMADMATAQRNRRLTESFQAGQRSRVQTLRDQLAGIGNSVAPARSALQGVDISGRVTGSVAQFNASEQARVVIETARQQSSRDRERNEILKRIELEMNGVRTALSLGFGAGGFSV
jgi:hypothetical protein